MPPKIETRFGRIRVERRVGYGRLYSISMTLLSLALAFLVVALILTSLGLDPIKAFQVIFGVFTKPSLLLESIKQSIPICLAALGLGIAFKMNFWNIGAEGQIYMGMIASTGIVLLHEYYGFFYEWMVMPLMFLTSFLLGGAWCLIPGALKARLGVNEILPTLMLNYVAILIVDFLVHGPWRDPKGYGFPLSIPFPEYAKLNIVLGDPAYTGLLLSILGAAAAFFLLEYTRPGFEIKVVGQSPAVARYAGIHVRSTILLGSFLAGGLAGIGGLSIVSGIIGRLRPGASPGYGYTAIIVAALAGLNPWVIVAVSIFFGGLITAGGALQMSMGIPKAAAQMIQAVIFLMILVGEFIKRYKVTIERPRVDEE
ncbi:MAG: ABC transporter permease [Thaumarchaeota archaeon]|nr:ABC transporter permease [Candidatus Wolframiiraptor allenii]